MQTQNHFLDFAEKVIARHSGFGYDYEPIAMIYLEDEQGTEQETVPSSQNIITNLYNIQNIKEENYLYRQNLTFLTQMLEKRLYQNLYPSVEKQIEKLVREEMPQAEAQIVKNFSQQMYRLVQRGGVEQFEILKERLPVVSREQEVLFRKIENIWSSSAYATKVVDTKVQNRSVQNINMQHINVQDLNVHNMYAQSTNVQNGNVQNTNVQNTNVQNGNVQKINVQNTNVRSTNVQDRNVQNTNVQDRNVQNTNVQDRNVQNTNVQNTNVQNGDVQNINVQGADVQNSNVQNANINTQNINEQAYNTNVHNAISNHIGFTSVGSVDAETQKETILEKTMAFIQRQEQMLAMVKPNGIGNLGMYYEQIKVQQNSGVHLEYLTESNVNEMVQSELNVFNRSSLHTDEIVNRDVNSNYHRDVERSQREEKNREQKIENSLEHISEKHISEKHPEHATSHNTINTEMHQIGNILESGVEDIRQGGTMHERFVENNIHTNSKNIREQVLEPVTFTYLEENQITEQQRILEENQILKEKQINVTQQTLEQVQKYFAKQKEIENHIEQIERNGELILRRNVLREMVPKVSLVKKWENNSRALTARKMVQDTLHLEYSNETDLQLYREMTQLVQREMEQPPEIPKVAQEHSVLIEKSQSMAEKILLRMESAGVVPVSRVKSAAKTVALQQLSKVIMEYADSRTTTEELHTRMSRVLERYQIENIRQVNEEVENVFESNEVVKHQLSELAFVQKLEPANIVYRSEEDLTLQQEERTNRLEQQVNDVVRNIKNVEEKTIVHKEEMIQQQKNVVREVLKSNPAIWTESEGANYIKREVQQTMEEQLNQNVNQIVNKIYRRLEDKLKTERGRRGLI